MNSFKEKFGLNSNALKLIAIVAMTIDHFTDIFFPGFPIEPVPMMLHGIGRLTAPIMWFFVCEGYFYTKNVKKYMLRLGIFAVISHFAYCFGFGIPLNPLTGGIFNRTSVMYPLFIAVVILYMHEHAKFSNALKFIITTVLIFSAFPADWSCIAVLCIVYMYGKRGNLKAQMGIIIGWTFVYALVSYLFVSKGYAIVQIGILMVYPVLYFYNGQRGKAKWMKWFFYIYYPLHLAVLGILRLMIYGNVNLTF
ncbi:TraX family protein [Butyrivibrio proteoclasticus]|uniref:TraX family protein n=1 Tax=Butyrivibrio proteoclasticus TaxID=43305 RepID=UPI00047BFF05|nr:TraX family protein [Butyrivibrio proteoclasticus]